MRFARFALRCVGRMEPCTVWLTGLKLRTDRQNQTGSKVQADGNGQDRRTEQGRRREKERKKGKERERRRKKERGRRKKEREEGGCTPCVLCGCHAKAFALDHFWTRLTVRTPDRFLLAGKVAPATRRLSASLGLQDVNLRAVQRLVICRRGHGGCRDLEGIQVEHVGWRSLDLNANGRKRGRGPDLWINTRGLQVWPQQFAP